jgi:hypothetical protein
MEVKGSVGRRRKQLLDDLKETIIANNIMAILSHKNRKDNFFGTKDQQHRSETSFCTKMLIEEIRVCIQHVPV